MAKLKLKKGDTVKVITGNNKGSTGEILKVLTDEGKVIVAGVNKVKKHTKPSSKNPYFNMVEVKNKKCEIVKKKSKRFFSRQAAPKVFDMNASIYLWERSSLLKKDIITKKTNYYIMPEYCIDIDTKYDLLFIESVIRKIKFKHGL